jgi:hypothetical protein
MASAEARAYNGGLGALHPVESRGFASAWSGATRMKPSLSSTLFDVCKTSFYFYFNYLSPDTTLFSQPSI